METAVNQKKWGVSGFVLKMIAVITMLIDHTAAVVLERGLMQAGTTGFVTYDNYEFWYEVYGIMRNLGRMAFPIYCFLLVEGFRHTKNLKKYILRLFLFALISEIPFDLAFNYSVLEFGYNNVFFTLWVGLLVIAGIQFVKQKISLEKQEGASRGIGAILQILATAAILLVGMFVVEVPLATDYGAAGVMAIFAIYALYQSPMLGFGAAVFFLAMMAGSTEIWAFLMLIPLYFYNGTRGKQVKYVFYGFYPVHLLLLVAVAAGIGLQIFG